jgi:hypothetical protein
MASDATIGSLLSFFQELFPTREFSPATLDAWSVVFASWDDDELRECARKVASEPGRTFFPTPGEVIAMRALPSIDGEAVLRRIAALGEPHPHQSWLYPRLETVREKLGDAVANAYAAAGSERCFSDAAVTKDIARRAFATDLVSAQKSDHTSLQLAASSIKQITSGGAS